MVKVEVLLRLLQGLSRDSLIPRKQESTSDSCWREKDKLLHNSGVDSFEVLVLCFLGRSNLT